MTTIIAVLDLAQVPEGVLDLFAVPGDVRPLTGARGSTVVAGDLLLTPGRDPDVQGWLSPLVARLAVTMDERPDRAPRALRLAVPVPARDGSWVVDGWSAARYEPGTRVCEDLDVVLAAGRLLHAELAVAVPAAPAWLRARDEAADHAGRLEDPAAAALVDELLAVPYDDPVPSQLVHTGLMGTVLLDAYGAPVVMDLTPAWRPPLWAGALAALDAVTGWDADPGLLGSWSTPTERGALAHAAAYRLLGRTGGDPAAYRSVLGPVLGTSL